MMYLCVFRLNESTYGILQDMTLYAMALRHRKWVLLPSKYGTEGVAELTQGRKDKSFALTPTRVAKVGRGPTAELHSIDMSVISEKRAGHRLFTGDERPAEGHESPRKSVDQSKVKATVESVDRVEADVVDSVADETISLAECSGGEVESVESGPETDLSSSVSEGPPFA
ncbi:unnamed protein product [Vicia faba]|uniref:Uncharacterized protein n=1 Tax=Vicia faba TaxID=3906 RepID=A0AAV0Z418_VICFA|nr:unnamed protein product [Vicia faba]